MNRRSQPDRQSRHGTITTKKGDPGTYSYGKISVHEQSAWTSLKFKARKCASLPLMHTQMNENVGAPTVCLRKSLRQVLIFCLVGLTGRGQVVDLDWTTDQLFTGTGYCSQTRSEKLLCFWLFSALPVSPWLANSTTFGRVPVSAVNGMVRRVCPMVTTLKQTLNARALPALLYRHPTGVYVLLFISSGTRLDPKCFFTFLILNLRGLGCMERCQILCLEEG
ncbi:hypothetical protein J6590_071636 [Homalodisca vitripennis]|nr:hypothetical protein J6590_071636 [Homalodisca vitripennis]